MLADVLGVGSWPDFAALVMVVATIMGAATGFTRWVLLSIRSVIQEELRPLLERVTKLEQWREIVDFELDHLKTTTNLHAHQLGKIDFEEIE